MNALNCFRINHPGICERTEQSPLRSQCSHTPEGFPIRCVPAAGALPIALPVETGHCGKDLRLQLTFKKLLWRAGSAGVILVTALRKADVTFKARSLPSAAVTPAPTRAAVFLWGRETMENKICFFS